MIEGFSQYGFPESHAASFALLTYISCWLKHHHPDVFTVALVNSQPMGFYPPRQLISDAERHGVRFHPLDVQHSEWDYTLIRSGHVRVGLRSVDGLGEAEARQLVQERQLRGKFRDIEDLVRRTRLQKKVLTKLATAGALFQLSSDPRQTLFALQGLDFNQQSFFYGTEPLGDAAPSLASKPLSGASAPDGRDQNAFAPDGRDQQHFAPDGRDQQHFAPDGRDQQHFAPDGRESIPPETEWEQVVREFRTKGFSLTNHPIGILRRQVLNQRALRARDGSLVPQYHTAEGLSQIRNGATVRLVGLRSLLQKPPTAKGVCFVSLEDETGIFNAIIMPDVYEKIRLVLYSANILEVYGVLQNYQGVVHVKAKEVRAFELPPSVLQLSPGANLGANLTQSES